MEYLHHQHPQHCPRPPNHHNHHHHHQAFGLLLTHCLLTPPTNPLLTSWYKPCQSSVGASLANQHFHGGAFHPNWPMTNWPSLLSTSSPFFSSSSSSWLSYWQSNSKDWVDTKSPSSVDSIDYYYYGRDSIAYCYSDVDTRNPLWWHWPCRPTQGNSLTV